MSALSACVYCSAIRLSDGASGLYYGKYGKKVGSDRKECVLTPHWERTMTFGLQKRSRKARDSGIAE